MMTEDNSLLFKNIHCYLIPGKYCGKHLLDIYTNAYEFWRFHWSKALSDINLAFSSSSEEFCRHDTVIVLCKEKSIIGIALMDIFDLDNPVHQKHIYFTKYNEEIILSLKKFSMNAPVYTFGYLAVSPEYRKDFYISDILLGIAFKKLITSKLNLMITYTRNSRKTHELTYRLGAKSILKNVTINGESSDFVYFNKDSLETFNKHVARDLIENIWLNTISNDSVNSKTDNNIKDEGAFYEETQL